MAKVLPFNGLLPTVEKVEKVSAVPYDVVNSEEAAQIAGDNELSFLRVSKPEIELEKGINLYSDAVYAKAAENFKKLCEIAPLELDKEKNMYVYYLKMDDNVQIGVVGASSTEDYDNDIIKKHEKTRQDKEDDRARHVMTLRSQTGPVFLTYKDNAEIDGVVEEIIKEKPLFDFTAEDGVVHKLWKTGETRGQKISSLFGEVPALYIADGHHRAASASRAAATCREQNPKHTGNEEYNLFLTVIFPGSQLNILPYNRAVHDLNGLSEEELISKIEDKFTIEVTDNPSPAKYAEICMFLGAKWYKLTPKFNVQELGVIERLDVSILQDNILAPLLGIDDPRTSKRIDFVGGIRGTKELERLVEIDRAKVAFSMYSTTVKQLMDIADADEIMPPKSTWFEPKLRDGLVCHNF